MRQSAKARLLGSRARNGEHHSRGYECKITHSHLPWFMRRLDCITAGPGGTISAVQRNRCPRSPFIFKGFNANASPLSSAGRMRDTGGR